MSGPRPAAAEPRSPGHDRPSFTIVLPPGWSRIPVGKGSASAIRRILDRAAGRSDDPRTAGVRRRLERTLTQQVEAAQERSGVEMYLPTEKVHGITVPASVLVSAPRVAEGTDPMDTLLAVAARGDGAEVVDIGGAPAVRTERILAPRSIGQGFDGSVPLTRQVVYFLADPSDRSRYLVLSAQVIQGEVPGAQAMGDAVVDLVDAMVSTFRWADDPEGGSTWTSSS